MKKFLFLFSAFIALTFASCKNDEVKIYSIMYNEDLEWFEEAIKGMEDAAKKNRVTFKNFNSYYDVDSEYMLAEKIIEEKPGAVLFCPLDNENSSRTAKYIKSHGIPVVTWNTVIDEPVSNQVVVDSIQLGAKTGEYLLKYFEANHLSKVKTALISNHSYSISEKRCNGFKDSIRPLVDSGKITLVQEVTAELPEETSRNVRHLLDANPDIELIWCWNQTTLLSCLQTLKELKRNDILLCGTDLSASLANEMLNPESNLIAVTTQQPYLMGYVAIENAICAYAKQNIEKVTEIPVMTFTKENTNSLKDYLESSKIR